MSVLVTGAGGFVGKALVAHLAQGGVEVLATDRACRGLAELGASRLFEGDICDAAVRGAALEHADAVIHLATVPGGAAEEDPELARRVNVDAAMALSWEFAAQRPDAPFVFASSIAVFGDPLPAMVDDETSLAPRMLYGAHKAMLETWLAMLSRRGQLSAISLRLPGIVARGGGPSGMKSAFISDLFHALASDRAIELPVSPDATTWLMSVRRVASCLAYAVGASCADLPDSRAVTLPAIRVRIGELVAEIARQFEADAGLVSFKPDAAIEQAFGRQPPLSTPMATRLGFEADGSIEQLVRSAIATL